MRQKWLSFLNFIIFTASIILMIGVISLINANAQAPQKAQIAFASFRDGNLEIYVMDVDGNSQRNLTNNPAHDFAPSWSPDGSKIAFERDAEEIYVMDAKGKNQHNLTNSIAIDRFPSWSPDGKKIIFSSFHNGNGDTCIMDADGNNQRILVKNLASNMSPPSWSPDGKKIVYETIGWIYVKNINADVNNPQNLAKSLTSGIYPSWSPDGKKIIYVAYRNGNFGIYVMDADGKNQQNLVESRSWYQDPSWSSDGKKIVFVSNQQDFNDEIYVMDADGQNQHRLTNSPLWDWGPRWFDPAVTYDVSSADKLISTWGRIKKDK